MDFDPTNFQESPVVVQPANRAQPSAEEVSRQEQEASAVLAEARKKAERVVSAHAPSMARRSQAEKEQYQRIYQSVRLEIQKFKGVLAAAEAKQRERVTLRNQTHGKPLISPLVLN